MLATGIKSPIGVKVTGNDLKVIDGIAAQVEQVAKGIPGVTSSLAERLTGGATSMSASTARPQGGTG